MAHQTGIARLREYGPIEIPNNTTSTIFTMPFDGLIFFSLGAFVNQDINPLGMIYYENTATGEPTGQRRRHVLFGNIGETNISGSVKNPYLGSPCFVPAGAPIKQTALRNGANFVRVYIYVLEFDTSVNSYGAV